MLHDHKGTRLRALVLPINKKNQTSRTAYLARMTADQSLFTEMLPDKRKAANGAAVEKGSGKDRNEKDSSCVEVPDEMEVSKSSGRKGKPSSTPAREKKALMMKGAKIKDFILAGFLYDAVSYDEALYQETPPY